MSTWNKPIDLAALDEVQHKQLATELYKRWINGEKKSPLEIEYFGNATSHGKFFTSYMRKWLGVETEGQSQQARQIARLEALLRAHGISPTEAGDLPEEYRLLAKARESALAGLRIYNDPLAGFRTESFIVLMIIAWNALLQAMLERDGVDYYDRGQDGRVIEIDGRGKVKDTSVLIDLALGGEGRCGMRHNLNFFLGLRNVIAHRYLPALDATIAGEAQAMLLNIESILAEEFGDEAQLGEQLAVPLQLSGFRDPSVLAARKQAQAALPVDVMNYLSRHREQVPDDVLRDPQYCLQVFFVPVTANRERSADAVVRFIKPPVPDELLNELEQLHVVEKPRRVPVVSDDLYRPSEVVNLVAERLPFRFTSDTHTRCWKHYGVRPPKDSSEPEATRSEYCCWDRLSRGYGYTKAWVEHLVDALSDPETYEEVVGFRPDPR
jgi:hypothetical protein